MFETVKLWLPDEQKTRSAGESLVRSLYHFPLTIFLKGDLGAGKTTFLQGFAGELGVVGPLTSPTYALEQHYVTNRGVPLIHIDLYRLKPADAEHILMQTDNHEGIRCVEWADRLEKLPAAIPHILVQLEEKNDGRELTISFNDIPLPSDKQIETWQTDVCLPANVRDHCDTVADVAARLTAHLHSLGTIVRVDALTKAAKAHDLLRFLDFKPDAAPSHTPVSPKEEMKWAELRERFPGMRHEEAAAFFLHEHGFDAVSSIVRTHGLAHSHSPQATVEQLLLYYADKRVVHDTVVSLRERFDDFKKRYGKSPDHWFDVAQKLEKGLFPDGPPF